MTARLQRSPIPSSVPKVLAFATITVLLIAVLATLIGNISLKDSRTYHALFTDATGVNRGDRVRLSGVEVGSVKEIQVVSEGERRLARLTFTVEDAVPLFREARLQLRFENIVGQRYLAIAETAGSGPRMEEGATFPVSQTAPALSLTQLFNGFQPLFRALDPERLNEFSFQLVRTLQGEAGTIQSLMRHTASLTNTLADRDEVIGSVLTNLETVLTTVGERDDELTALIVQFRNLMRGLATDGDAIEAALPSLASLLGSTSGMIAAIRPPLKADVEALHTLSGQLYDTRASLDASLQRLPVKLRALARTGSYGSWFNFYVCGLGVQLQLLDSTVDLATPMVASNERDTVCGAGGQL